MQARKKTALKAGGQNDHVGTTLTKVGNPDRTEVINVDRRNLPAVRYRQVEFESRQVYDIECPESIKPKIKGKRGRIKKSKSGNLLERLRDYEKDTL